MFPISRDPPEGGTHLIFIVNLQLLMFPISRDPPEGGTCRSKRGVLKPTLRFPISRDPPEGGTSRVG